MQNKGVRWSVACHELQLLAEAKQNQRLRVSRCCQALPCCKEVDLEHLQNAATRNVNCWLGFPMFLPVWCGGVTALTASKQRHPRQTANEIDEDRDETKQEQLFTFPFVCLTLPPVSMRTTASASASITASTSAFTLAVLPTKARDRRISPAFDPSTVPFLFSSETSS